MSFSNNYDGPVYITPISNLDYNPAKTTLWNYPRVLICIDIGVPTDPKYKKFLDTMSLTYNHILIVPGPKERGHLELLRSFEDERVKVMQKDVIHISFWTFVGCSLWTCIPSPIREKGSGADEAYARSLSRELGLTEDELNAEHIDHLLWLGRAIETRGKNVAVLTYTPPSGINNLQRLEGLVAHWHYSPSFSLVKPSLRK